MWNSALAGSWFLIRIQNVSKSHLEGIEPYLNRISFVSQEHNLFNEQSEFILLESILHETSLTNTH